MITKVPTTVYHYTSEPALLSIMQNHSLWGSHAAMLNDRRELVEGLQLISAILTDKLDKSSRRKRVGQKTLFDHRLSIMKFLAESVSQDLETDVYVTSFSAKMDSLSQWRAYGSELAGFAIGFRTELLMDAFSDAKLVKVQYFKPRSDGGVKAAAGSDVEKVIRKLDEIATSGKVGEVRSKLLQIAASIKHYSFREEAEWRLIAIDHPRPVKFRDRKGVIVPYIELSATSEDGYKMPLPIRSIWVHPCEPHQFRGTQLKLYETLEKLNYSSVTVRASSIPYRMT